MRDELDSRLIDLLRADARQPVAGLARALQVSRATVQHRIDRLLASGVVQGFTLRLAPREPNQGVRAVTLLAVLGERMEAVARTLRRLPELRALHSTNGRWDLVAEVETGNLAEFDQLLARIRRIDGVSATETSLLLASLLG